jgi:hypothetical protein
MKNMKNDRKIAKTKLAEEDQNIKSWKIDCSILTNENPINKQNSIWGENFKIECLITQLGIFHVLIEFITDLIARKLVLIQFGL